MHVRLRKTWDAHLVLVNVQPSYEAFPNFHQFVSRSDVQVYIRETAEKIFEKAIGAVDQEGVEIEKVVCTGIPKVEITKLAKDRQASSIIMGTRGFGAVKSAFIGSVSLGVLTDSLSCHIGTINKDTFHNWKVFFILIDNNISNHGTILIKGMMCRAN